MKLLPGGAVPHWHDNSNGGHLTTCAELGQYLCLGRPFRGAGWASAAEACNLARLLSHVRFPKAPFVIISLAHQDFVATG